MCCVEEGTCARGRVGSRWDAVCETLPMNLHGTLPRRKKESQCCVPHPPHTHTHTHTHTDSYSLTTTENTSNLVSCQEVCQLNSNTLQGQSRMVRGREWPLGFGHKGTGEAGPQSSLPCVLHSSVASVSKERVRIPPLSCTSTHIHSTWAYDQTRAGRRAA